VNGAGEEEERGENGERQESVVHAEQSSNSGATPDRSKKTEKVGGPRPR
jgi:hypothetical protein